MLKKHVFTLFFFGSLFSLSNGQQKEFDALFVNLKAAVKPVETSKYTYRSDLTFINTSVIRYGYTKTSLKGSAKSYEYELNFADIDPYTVRENVEGDVIVVKVNIKNSQKLVKSFEDGLVKAYTDEIEFIATDIDDARKIRELIESSIPLAEKIMENKLSLNGFNEMLTWLEQNVKDVKYEDGAVNQSFIHDPKYTGKIDLTIIETGKTGKQDDYAFNLADINMNTLNFKISGSKFALVFETIRNHNLIKHTQDGEAKSFVSDIIIMTNNVEEARDLRTVLNLIIPESKKQVEASFPEFSDLNMALNKLSEYTKIINYGNETIDQKMKPECLTEFTTTAITESKSDIEVYGFNWMDINEKVIDYDVSGSKMFIEVLTDQKKKLMSLSKQGELSPYDESFKIYCEDAENARRLKYALNEVITRCKASYKYQVPSGNAMSKINWLKENVKEVRIDDKTYSQRLELVDNANSNKFKFSQTIVNSSGGTEYVYELNFSDLNEINIDYDISGKTVSITLETNFKEKIIKAYKQGEIQNYEDGFEIQCNNIEEARNLMKALVDIIELQKKS